MKTKFLFLFVVLLLVIGWLNNEQMIHNGDIRYVVDNKYSMLNMIIWNDSIMKEKVKGDKRLNSKYIYVIEWKGIDGTVYRELTDSSTFNKIHKLDRFLLKDGKLVKVGNADIYVNYNPQNEDTWLLK